MTSAFLLSIQSSLRSAWQLGQLRLRQELLWKSMCPQSAQTETLQPSFPDLHAMMEEAAFICTGEGLKEAAYTFQALSKTC